MQLHNIDVKYAKQLCKNYMTFIFHNSSSIALFNMNKKKGIPLIPFILNNAMDDEL